MTDTADETRPEPAFTPTPQQLEALRALKTSGEIDDSFDPSGWGAASQAKPVTPASPHVATLVFAAFLLIAFAAGMYLLTSMTATSLDPANAPAFEALQLYSIEVAAGTRQPDQVPTAWGTASFGRANLTATVAGETVVSLWDGSRCWQVTTQPSTPGRPAPTAATACN